MAKSSDFEVHDIGTATELRLSRALCNALEAAHAQQPSAVPEEVWKAYQPLRAHHQAHLAKEGI